MVKLLLNNNAEVNTKDEEIGWTTLHFAAMKRHEAAVELLVNKKADVNAKGWTSLQFAVENGDEAVVELLVKNKVDSKVKAVEID